MIKKLSMKHRLSITRSYYSQIIKLSITRWYYSQYTIKLMLWIWDYFAFTTVCQKTAAQAVKLDFRFCFVFFFNLNNYNSHWTTSKCKLSRWWSTPKNTSNGCDLIFYLKVRKLSFHQFWCKIREEWLENRMLCHIRTLSMD